MIQHLEPRDFILNYHTWSMAIVAAAPERRPAIAEGLRRRQVGASTQSVILGYPLYDFDFSAPERQWAVRELRPGLWVVRDLAGDMEVVAHPGPAMASTAAAAAAVLGEQGPVCVVARPPAPLDALVPQADLVIDAGGRYRLTLHADERLGTPAVDTWLRPWLDPLMQPAVRNQMIAGFRQAMDAAPVEDVVERRIQQALITAVSSLALRAQGSTLVLEGAWEWEAMDQDLARFLYGVQ